MKKIIVTCQMCNKILLTAEGIYLVQSDADSYQQNCACDTDGQSNITAILATE